MHLLIIELLLYSTRISILLNCLIIIRFIRLFWYMNVCSIFLGKFNNIRQFDRHSIGLLRVIPGTPFYGYLLKHNQQVYIMLLRIDRVVWFSTECLIIRINIR